MVKTNAARILDGLKIPYELLEYEVDEEDLSAVHLAATTGMDIHSIYKTLVLKGDNNNYLVGVIRGDKTLDLKKIAQASGNKRCELINLKDLLKITGYIRGGCSPIGMKKKYPTFIDNEASTLSQLFVSAGKRGVQIKIAPADLKMAADAVMADICL